MLSMRGVTLEQSLEDWRQIRVLDGGDQFPREALLVVSAAADHDLVAFGAHDLGPKKPDIADVVLCARVRTASHMEIHRL